MSWADGPPGSVKPADDLTELAPTQLLAHAEFLADRASASAVAEVHARRAVSAAYYAVLHRATTYVAWAVAPDGADDARYELCRTFTHAGAARVSRWLNGSGASPKRWEQLVDSARLSPGLATYSQRFVQLQDWREAADYNHLVRIDQSIAHSAVQSARIAVEAVAVAWDEPGWSSFCTLMLVHGTAK